MKSIATVLALVGVATSLGCGDDTTSSSGGSGGGSSSSEATASTSSGSPASVGSNSGAGGDGGDDVSSQSATGTGGAGQGGGGTGGGAGGGPPVGCDDLAPGPFEPALFSSAFDGSEDIAFDGLGHLAGKQGPAIILLDADGNETILVGDDVPDAFGTRYAPDGSLVVALPNEGVVVAISPEGDASPLGEDLSGPNGIHVTSDGTVWVTELPAGRVQTIAPGEDPVPFLDTGEAPDVNGIYVDEARDIVFYTNYALGEIRRIDRAGTETPTLVATVGGAKLDGLTMDVCGNLYAVDQVNAYVYRLRTDEAGDLVGGPELIAELPTGIANAQFGRGAGFSPTTLYAAGTPGDVYAIDVGVEGAPLAGP